MDIAKLNNGKTVVLLVDNAKVKFAEGNWCLVASPIDKPAHKRLMYWVKSSTVAKRYSIQE